MSIRKAALVAVAAALVAGCGSSTTTTSRPSSARFVERVDNPWFPLLPGSVYVYEGVKDGRAVRDVVRVTPATKTIQGVHCTAVSDLLYAGPHVVERTTDWYAQDGSGNVWYFGEATAELNLRGKVTSTEGSWQSGVDGAHAGIYMPADPRVGHSGLQEYYRGHAEDHFQVLSLDTPVRSPAVSSRHALLTKEWTPLEPRVIDHKLYVRGTGTVREETVRGPQERLVLLSVRMGS